MIPFAEQVSWFLQGLIRRWSFLVAISLGSVIWWATTGFLREDPLVKWNAVASLAAIQIEMLVGLAMYNQTRRDAIILRKVLKLLDRVLEEVEATDDNP